MRFMVKYEAFLIADWKMWLQVNLSMTHVVHDINWSLLFGGLLYFMVQV